MTDTTSATPTKPESNALDFTIEDTKSYEKRISITVPVTDVNKAYDSAYKSAAKSARIPGFRPGKAPRQILKSHYGDAIDRDVQDRLIQQSVFKILIDNKVEIVSEPVVQQADVPAQNATYQFTASVEVRPDVTVDTVEGLKVPVTDATVADEEVQEALEALRQKNFDFSPVEDRSHVADGDFVDADYEAFDDEGNPVQGTKVENSMVEIADDGMFPGLREGLLGAEVPSELKVPITFPDDYSVPTWQGQTLQFTFKLKGLKTKTYPALDDDFAADEGEESLEALTTKTRAKLEKDKADEVEKARKDALLDALIEANPVEVPPSMIESSIDRKVRQIFAQFAQATGQSFDPRSEHFESIRDSLREQSARDVKAGLLLDALSTKLELKIEDAEMEEELKDIATKADTDLETVQKAYASDEAKNILRSSLVEKKTIEWLFEKSTTA